MTENNDLHGMSRILDMPWIPGEERKRRDDLDRNKIVVEKLKRLVSELESGAISVTDFNDGCREDVNSDSLEFYVGLHFVKTSGCKPVALSAEREIKHWGLYSEKYKMWLCYENGQIVYYPNPTMAQAHLDAAMKTERQLSFQVKRFK